MTQANPLSQRSRAWGFGWGPDRRFFEAIIFVINQLVVAVRLPPFPFEILVAIQ
jgi:hypothetical protein